MFQIAPPGQCDNDSWSKDDVHLNLADIPDTCFFKLYTPDEVNNQALPVPPADRDCMLRVLHWTTHFIMKPHPQMGRSGAVCPFVKPALESGLLRLGVYRHVYSMMQTDAYQALLMVAHLFWKTAPLSDETALLKTWLILLPDLPEKSVEGFMEPLHKRLKTRLLEDKLLIGQFYPGCAISGSWNPHFRPLQSPVPMFVFRNLIESDWRFVQGTPEWEKQYQRYYPKTEIQEINL